MIRIFVLLALAICWAAAVVLAAAAAVFAAIIGD